MPLIRILVLVFGFFGTTASAADPPVRVWLDSILLPAYPEGEAGTIPDFDAWTKEVANYPYPLLSNYGTKPQDHRWRSINLENEYLLCRVLPDLGGHLYSCRDKRNGREVFYANPVVKPAQVGLRGAFAAMGIESNFPFGHTRINTSPVDFALRTDPDGSAHAIVADIDRVTGMQWRVEFILQSGSSVLEQRVTLYNRSSARRPYYWWANAEIPLDDPGTRMVLPARVASTHTTPPEIIAWPAQVDGKDAAVVANNKAQAGWFAYGSREPFFAIYKPGSRSGLAHFADPKAVAGKKLWVWGHDGDAWVRKELTDNFPSYVEMQAGVFQDQDTLNFLNPEQTNSFSESWIPIFDLGGVSRVTSDAILNLDRSANHGKGPGLVLELSATHAIRGAAIRVLSEGKVVFNTTADLTPAAIYSHVLESPSASPYTVELADSQNRILLRHTENTYDTVAPEKAPLGKVPDPLPKADSEEHDLARGDFYVLHHLPALAWNEYSNGLRRYPRSLPIRKAAGQLALSLSRFDEAANLLRVAAGADDQAIYALGAAEALAGHDADGYRELARIRPDSAAAAAASLQLSKIAARARNTAAALAALHPLLTGVAHSTRAGALEVALLRRSGQTEPARKALERWQTLDPSDSMLRFESTLLGRKDDELWSHLALDSERVLNLVDEYLSLGMETDALLLLDHPYPSISGAAVEPGAVPVALSPMIAYYRAFCRSRLHQDPFPDLRAATAGFTHYLFPNRASSFAVLTTATRLNPSDALAHLLLGRLLLNSLLGDQAIAEFRRALQLNPKLPETHYDLARTLIDVQKNPAAALETINQGLRIDSSNSELRGLSKRAAEVLTSLPASPAVPPVTATATAPRNAPSPRAAASARAPSPDPPSAAPIDIAANALIKAGGGNAGAAAAMFNGRTFSAEKQPDTVRRAYIETRIQNLTGLAMAGQCAKAMDLLFTLGNEDTSLSFTMYGFDHFMKAPHFQYFLANIEDTCHDEKAARKRWTKISKQSETLPSADFPFPLLAASRLSPAEARPKIAAARAAVTKALSQADPPSRASLLYIDGVLLEAEGQQHDAQSRFQEVLASSQDPWLKYLALVEVQRAAPPPR